MKKHIFFGGVLVAVGFLALFIHKSAFVAASSDARYLHVYVDGSKKTIASQAKTVGEALKSSGITLYSHDKSEPSVDSEITSNDFNVTVYRARPITVIDGPNTYTVTTSERTPRAIAESAGFKPKVEDGFEYENSDSPFNGTPGTRLYIKRSKEIILELYGTASKLRTQELTVQNLLNDKGITLDKGDEVSPALETKITAGMKISIAQVSKKVKTVEENIPFDEEQIRDANQPVSYRKVKTPGKNGSKLVTYEIVIRNGKEYRKKTLKEVITKQPVTQIAIVGDKNTSFSGDFASALARLRGCEGAYTSNTGNGYYGAYQYDLGTWGNYKGYPNASAAPPAVQDQKAWETYKARGWQPWPSCSISQGLQDIYR